MPTDSQRPPKPHPDYVPATTFTDLVHRLHAAVIFFARPQSTDVTDMQISEHHFDMHHFACALEATFGHSPLLTSNLHTMVCRLADQCRERGHSGHEGELWIERSVQVLTRAKGTAITPHIEALVAKRLALDDAIMRISRDFPEAGDVT